MGKLMYWIAYYIVNIYFKVIARWQVRGRNNLPEEGALIVTANHISELDPPIVGCVLNRQVFFMAKEELFTNPVMGWIFRQIGVFPVRRGRPDRKALRRALQILEEGDVLGLFPEGTRRSSGNPGQAKAGAVMIALKSESPLLPIGIKNADNEKQIKVSIGTPYKLDEYYERKLSREEKREVGEVIMDKIKEELNKLD